MNQTEQLLRELAVMDSIAIDRERLVEQCVFSGDEAGFQTLLDEWTEEAREAASEPGERRDESGTG